MDARPKYLVACAFAAAWALCGCAAKSDATAPLAAYGASDAATGMAPRAVRASAAQRIELAAPGAAAPRAAAADPAGAPAIADAGARLLPEAPEEIRLPDGTVGIKVAQKYLHTIVACRRSDGTFTNQCPVAAERNR